MGRENKDCLGGVLLRRLADQDKQLCLFFTSPLAANEKKLPLINQYFSQQCQLHLCIFIYPKSERSNIKGNKRNHLFPLRDLRQKKETLI
jgi:hypothetical protein